jgi:hypothetical protein
MLPICTCFLYPAGKNEDGWLDRRQEACIDMQRAWILLRLQRGILNSKDCPQKAKERSTGLPVCGDQGEQNDQEVRGVETFASESN